MPLDGHAYLVSQGWSGKGSGLRHGAISRPVTITQKKTLAGIGKDRDEAFPFWDHVFSAAASKIKIPVSNSDDESDDAVGTSTTEVISFAKTRTGIISNRRPIVGSPVDSGCTTPSTSSSGTNTPRMSVMAAAKQEAARRVLYSMFYRGPVMKSEDQVLLVEEEIIVKEVVVEEQVEEMRKFGESKGDVIADESEKKKRKKEKMKHARESEGKERLKKRRKREDPCSHGIEQDEKAAKKARKEEKRRLKAARKVKGVEVASESPQVARGIESIEQRTSAVDVLQQQNGPTLADRETELQEPSEAKKKKRRRENSS